MLGTFSLRQVAAEMRGVSHVGYCFRVHEVFKEDAAVCLKLVLPFGNIGLVNGSGLGVCSKGFNSFYRRLERYMIL